MKNTNPFLGYLIILFMFGLCVAGVTYIGLTIGVLDKPIKYEYGGIAIGCFTLVYILAKTTFHHDAIEHHESFKNSLKYKENET